MGLDAGTKNGGDDEAAPIFLDEDEFFSLQFDDLPVSIPPSILRI